MKIAISGLNPEEHKKLITQVQAAWPLYVNPVKTIFDEREETEEDDDDFKKLVDEMKLNEDETNNFRGWYLLQKQYEKYKNQKYIIYNGSPIDLLCEAVVFAAHGLISDEYMNKIIYYHKKYMSPKNLDIVWWMPNKTGTDELEEHDAMLESVYNNLWDNYQTNFDKSPYFNHERCSAYSRFDTLDYLDEMRYLIDLKGNAYAPGISNVDEEELKAALRNHPDLYQIYIDAKNAQKLEQRENAMKLENALKNGPIRDRFSPNSP